MGLLASVVDGALAIVLSPEERERLGRHILNAARGEGNGDPKTNGEYFLLNSLKKTWRTDGTSLVVFDVGANIGAWSARVLLCMPDSKVYAFEPSPEAFRVLSANPSIHAMNLALGENETRLPFYVSEAGAESNSLHERRAHVHFGLEQTLLGEVEVRRGDQFADSLNIQRIHFLKIDTEGHELAVLKGFAQMLAHQGIDYVQFEYGCTWADSRTLLMDAFDLLLPLGYQIAKIHSKGVQFFPEYDQRQETFAFANYLAVRRELASTLKAV